MPKAHFKPCLVLAAFVWIVVPEARVGDGDAAARLVRQIDPTVAFFQAGGPTVPPETLADGLVDGNARRQLFRLESLLRIYGRALPDLEPYNRKVKELEDGLGAYTLTVDSLNFASEKFRKDNRAQAPDAARRTVQEHILEGLARDKDVARGVLAALVKKSTLSSDLPRLRSLVVSRLADWSPSKNLSFVTGELQRVLRDAKANGFNFNRLSGIHDYRKALRWFPILVDALDGLIVVRDDAAGACPVPALAALAGTPTAKHRYSNPALSVPAAHPCVISRCLLWQVVKTTNDLGHVKDEAEGNTSIAQALDNDYYVISNDHVTPEEVARAKAIRAELLKSRALDVLISQLSSCKP